MPPPLGCYLRSVYRGGFPTSNCLHSRGGGEKWPPNVLSLSPRGLHLPTRLKVQATKRAARKEGYQGSNLRFSLPFPGGLPEERGVGPGVDLRASSARTPDSTGCGAIFHSEEFPTRFSLLRGDSSA